MEAFHSAYTKVILAYHWSIKKNTGLPLVVKAVFWPIIDYLYCITSLFYRYYEDLQNNVKTLRK